MDYPDAFRTRSLLRASTPGGSAQILAGPKRQAKSTKHNASTIHVTCFENPVAVPNMNSAAPITEKRTGVRHNFN